MEGRAGRVEGRSHRPGNVNELIARAITWTGIAWMVIDTSFTISRAFDVFQVPSFFVKVVLAIGMGVACGAAQKALFEVLVNSSKRNEFLAWWNSGVLGKVFVVGFCIFIFGLIHFSWLATGASISVGKGAFAIPNFGIKDLAPITTYFSGVLAGLVVAFMDEMLFLIATILKD